MEVVAQAIARMKAAEPEGPSGSRNKSEPLAEVTGELWKLEKVSATLLGLALVVGGCLRLYQIGSYELTIDEAQAWYAASAPTLAYVVKVVFLSNPGNLALHELALHFWIKAFGESVVAMRLLSVVLGTIAIPFVFVVARELLEFDRSRRDEAERIAALSALIFALSLPAIHYSREVRSYELMLVLALAQVWFFARASRSDRLVDLLGAALLAFLTAAAGLANGIILAAEGVWLLAFVRRSGWQKSWRLAISLAPGALAAGLAILGNPSAAYEQTQMSWQRSGATAFMRAAHAAPLNIMCVFIIGLAVGGTIHGWREARATIWFALLWMWIPVVLLACFLGSVAPLLLIILSFWFPSLLQRYVLTCVVPFSILAAIGIWRMRRNPLRLGAIVLFVALALLRTASYYGSQGEGVGNWGVEWREAAAFAASEAKAGRPIAIYPKFSEFVVLYYARNSTSVPPFTPGAHLLLVSPNAGDPSDPNLHTLRWGYPRDIAHFNWVAVWADR